MDSNYVCGGLGSPNPDIDQGSTVVKKRHEKIAPSPATLPKGQSVHEAQEECKLKKEQNHVLSQKQVKKSVLRRMKRLDMSIEMKMRTGFGKMKSLLILIITVSKVQWEMKA